MKKLLVFGCITGLALMFGLALAASPQDTYVFQTIGAIDTLDPEVAYDTASSEIIQNVYDTLYEYKGVSTTEYVPALATSYKISDDSKTYTYTLRQGVKFHSGNPMTCEDVQWSLRRDLVINSSDSGNWFLADPLLGAQGNANDYVTAQAKAAGVDTSASDWDPSSWSGADKAYSDYWNKITNAVKCLDDHTIQFNLDHVDPAFFVKLMFPSASVIDSKTAIAHGEWDGTEKTYRDWVGKDVRQYWLNMHDAGTGPYQIVSADANKQVATRFDGYWGKAPAIKNVIVEYVKDQSARFLALKQGDADRVNAGDLATALAQLQGAPGVNVESNPDWSSAAVGVIFFNQKINMQGNSDVGSGKLDGKGIPSDFFSDINARKCFAYSFDQKAFINQVLAGHGVELTMGLPPSFLGYNKNLPVYDLNPEKAEQYCKKAWDGKLWDTGFTLTATYNTGNTSRQAVLSIIKKNLEALNPKFHINIRGISWPDYLKVVDNSAATMFALGWAPDYMDPTDYIPTFYHGYFTQYYHYNNAKIDKLIKQAGSITDPQQRALLYEQIGSIAYDTVPFVPYPTVTPFLFIRSDLKGAYYNSAIGGGSFYWKDVSKQ